MFLSTFLWVIFLSTIANAQCTGNFPAGFFCGTINGGLPGPAAFSGAVAPIGGLTLLASPSGTGNCITSACKLPTACSFVTQVATYLGTPFIQLADGTYTADDLGGSSGGHQCHLTGNGGGSSNILVQVVGNPVTPSNVVIAIQSTNQTGFYVEDTAELAVSELKFTNVNGGGSALTARQNAIVDYHDIQWGTWGNSGNHVAAFGNAVIVNPGNETLLANTTFIGHWVATQGAFIIPGGTTTIQSSVTWTQFASATNSNFDTSSWTLSGTGTGQQFTGLGIGYLNSGATPCASVFPGTGGCTLQGGFQTSAGDNPTSVVPVGGVSCPSGVTAGTVTVVKGVVTHC